MKDSFSHAVVGEPALPYYSKIFAIPESDSIEVNVSARNTTTIENIYVYPAPRIEKSPTDTAYFDEYFEQDDSLYARDQFFPGEQLRVETIGYLRGQRLARIAYYPVQFNPVTETATVATAFDITIVSHNPSSAIIQNAGPMQDVVAAVTLNYDAAGGPMTSSFASRPSLTSGSGQVCWCTTDDDDWPAAANWIKTNCQPDYLIIMADELNDSLVGVLADHRADYNGFNVAIVKMSQIEDSPNTTETPDSIRLFIKDIYDSQTAAHMGDDRLAYAVYSGINCRGIDNPDHSGLARHRAN